jgi:flavin-dependent dehydrogenase
MASRNVDIAVIGGGPGGIATALSIDAPASGSVLVVEATDYSAHRIGEVLPARSFQALQTLGAWEAFLGDGHLSSPGFCSSWQLETCGHLDLIADPFGSAWHLDRRRFDLGLARNARDRGIEVIERHRLIGCQPRAQGGYALVLSGPGDARLTVTATLVADATGRAARVARRLGSKRHAADRLVAACCLMRGAPTDRLTRIEATEAGWWYLVGLPGDLTMIAFFTDADLAHRLGMNRSRNWSEALQATHHIRHALGPGAEPMGRVRIHPAQSSILRPAQGADWIAVGDAALARDPLSSHGIQAALASGIDAGAWIGRLSSGHENSAEQRQAALEAGFKAYLDRRHAYYAMVTRWPGSPFWSRRGDEGQPKRNSG